MNLSSSDVRLAVVGFGLAVLSAGSALQAVADAVATGCPDFDVELPRKTGGVVLQAADFGFAATNELNGAAIQRALDEARRQGASRLELAPGTYRCFDDSGVDIRGLSDFTLDGKGARLVFRRPIRAPGASRPEIDCSLRVVSCTRVRIADISCDWDWETMPLGEFVRVVGTHVDDKADNASFIDYELVDYSRSRPHPSFGGPLPLVVCNAMTEDRRSFRRGTGGWCNGHREGYYGAKMSWLSPSRIRVWPSVKDEQQPYLACYDDYFGAEQNRRTVRAAEQGGFYRLVNYYYGKGCFYFVSNHHLTIERCAVESTFGGGLGVEGDQHHWQLIDCRFGQADDARRIYPVTTTCDALHVSRSRGFAKFVRCRWNRHLDDACNFHDCALLAGKSDTRRIRAVSGQEGFRAAEVGTHVELFEENYDATGFTGRIVRIDGAEYELDGPVPDPRFGLFVVRNCETATDNLLIRDCDFTDACMRNLIQGSQVTIEGTTFRRMSGSPLRIMTEWTRKWWVEGTRATNVVVRNCVFDSNQIDGWLVDGVISEIFCGARLAAAGGGHDGSQVPPPGDQAVGRILVEGCTFINPRGATLHAVSGRDYVFRNNVVRIGARKPDDPPFRGKCLSADPTRIRIESGE